MHLDYAFLKRDSADDLIKLTSTSPSATNSNATAAAASPLLASGSAPEPGRPLVHRSSSTCR